ncbi:hypothetical protein D3C71_1900040 [compost metagenome]
MTCDVPARIEAHAGFAVRQHLYTLGIKSIEAGVRQDTPVRGLQIVQPVKLVFTFKCRGTVRQGLEAQHQVAQTTASQWLERSSVLSQKVTLLLVKPSKTQASAKAAALYLT